jgi:hypothetical protein
MNGVFQVHGRSHNVSFRHYIHWHIKVENGDYMNR